MRQVDTFWRNSLKLRHLRLLIAIDEHRHIGRVAASLNVTQPAISKALAEVEDGLGLKLFERTPTGVRPTVYGECLVRHAKGLDADLIRARDQLKALAVGATGAITVGALPAAAAALLPRALALFKGRLPNTTVIVREGPFDVLLPELRARKVDFVVGTLRPSHGTDDLKEKSLSAGPLTLVARKGHPLARQKRITWAKLANYQWVLPPVSSFLRQPLENAFARNGLPIPANCVETNATHMISAYLSMTDSLSFVQEEVARHFGERGDLCALPLKLAGLLRPTGVMWSRDYPPDPLALRFIDCLQEVAGGSQ